MSVADLIRYPRLQYVPQDSAVVLSKEKPCGDKRWYYTTESVDELIGIIKNNNEHLYEVIRTDKPRKLYLDLEWQDGAFSQDNEVIQNQFIAKVQDWMSHKFNVLPESIAISGCTYPTKIRSVECVKFSRHVVFNYSKVFRNHKEMKQTVDEMFDDIKDIPDFSFNLKSKDGEVVKTLHIMDRTVYGKSQNMKLIHQSKLGKPGIQEPLTLKDSPDLHLCGQYTESQYFNVTMKHTTPETQDNTTKTNNKNQHKPGNLVSTFPVRQCIPETVNNNYLQYVVDSIPNDDVHWDHYFMIAAAIKRSTTDFDVFDSWSKKSKKYDSVETRKTWNSIDVGKHGYNKGTLFNLAKTCNPQLDSKSPAVANLTNLVLSENIENTQYTERYVRPIKSNTRFHVIQSHCGTGKTTTCVAYIDDLLKAEKTSFLIMSPRRSYAEAITSEYNRRLQNLNGAKVKCYMHEDIDADSESPYVVCSPQSMFRLDSVTFDTVIIDECESVLNEFVSSTMKIRGFSNAILQSVRNFEYIIKKAKKVVMCDAFISMRTIRFCNTLGNHETIHFEQNLQPCVPRKAFELTSKTMFHQQLDISLTSGNNVVAYVDSKKEIKDLYTYCEVPDDHVFVHADADKKSKNTVKHVNEEWRKKLLAYNSCITVGIDFNQEHYDELFMFCSIYCGIIRDNFQSSMRVRHLRKNNMYYYLMDKKGCIKDRLPQMSTFSEAQEYVQAKRNEVLAHSQYVGIQHDVEVGQQQMVTDYSQLWRKPPQWLSDLYAWQVFEKSVNQHNYNNLFQHYLRINNYTIVKGTEEHKETTPSSTEVEVPNYDDIDIPENFVAFDPEKSADTLHQIRSAKWQYNKAFAHNKDAQHNKLFRHFIDDRTWRLNSFFWNVWAEDASDAFHLDKKDRIENKYHIFSNERSQKRSVIDEIMKTLEIGNSMYLGVLKPERLDHLHTLFEAKYRDYSKVFGISETKKQSNSQVSTLRSTTTKLNKLLSRWNGCSVKSTSRTKKEKGSYSFHIKKTKLSDILPQS